MVYSNVVPEASLRRVQLETMEVLKDTLLKTFGPFGSNTIIDTWNDIYIHNYYFMY